MRKNFKIYCGDAVDVMQQCVQPESIQLTVTSPPYDNLRKYNGFTAGDHILSWSNPGDTVLDPFVGSGTTGKMAVLNGRSFIGCDISMEYSKMAVRRIEEA